MEEYKLCPVCGTKNSPDTELCDSCGVDISGEQITSDNAQAQRKEEEMFADSLIKETEDDIVSEDNNDAPISESTMFRVCDECGYYNPGNARKCKCGNDISDITPIAGEKDAGKPELVSEDGAFTFDIPEGETIIGRENKMSTYLEKMMYVSRKHGKLINIEGKVYYEDLHSTNGTLINQQTVYANRVRLVNGDRLYLGHNPASANNDRSKIAYFIFKQ